MRSFDPLQIPLEGEHLVEASAGTGKTHNITFLVVRLVAQLGLAVDEILVVTFTEAATRELREKIRGTLVAVLAALEGRAAPDAAMAGLVEKLTANAEISTWRLRRAVADFDQASVSTIHGFCRKVLEENAFESGAPFSVELVADQSEMYREICTDYWALKTFDASLLFLGCLEDRGVGIDRLVSLIKKVIPRPRLEVLSHPPAGSEEDFVEVFKEARRLWRADADEIVRLLVDSDALNRSSWKVASIPHWAAALDRFMAPEDPMLAPRPRSGKNHPARDVVWRFSRSNLEGTVKKGKEAPRHPFFDTCERLLGMSAILDDLVNSFLLDVIDFARNELPRRKEERGIQSFDDLLLRLDRALADGKRGSQLSRTLRDRYGAVLIDEFQDTDPVQYDIFRRVFVGTGTPLFFIGDPKQSIYGFRGGDIFTYMEAASRVSGGACTLSTNWRSDPGLVNAVNTLFGGVRDPFLFEQIGFDGVAPRPGALDALRLGEEAVAPMQIAVVERPEGTGVINKGWADENLATMVASDIAGLIGQGITILGREDPIIGPGDIAVLVLANYQAAAMQKALGRLGIMSVLWSDKSVFETTEANDVACVLAAVSEPGRSRRIRAALATDMVGLNCLEIDELERDDREWDRWVERFRRWRDLWNERGFMAMFREILEIEILEGSMATRVLSGRDGERRMTNLNHLAQLIHHESRVRKLGMFGVLAWLERAMGAGGPGSEDSQLRLESDRNAVRLVTIHKAKGLQYPVVYVPFMWNGKLFSEGEDAVLFHDPERPGSTGLDLGSRDRDRHVALATREEMAEKLRVLYVALTRAEHLCKVVWGRFKDSETSPLAYLLHNQSGSMTVQEVARRVSELTDGELLQDLFMISGRAKGSVVVTSLSQFPVLHDSTDPAPLPVVKARRLERRFDRPSETSSFSRMTSFAEEAPFQELEGLDRDDGAPEVADGEGPTDPADRILLADFEASSRAGSCLHEILERADLFDPAGHAFGETVRAGLERYGFDASRWSRPVWDAVSSAARTPLDMEDGALSLSGIGRGRSVAEMEFLIPVPSDNNLRARSLAAAMERGRSRPFPDGYGASVERLGFRSFEGFFKGFIDLVFEYGGRWYLVDYKSNHLGNGYDDYRPALLDGQMARHHYFLQYHLYVLALHRHLASCHPGYSYERHFGGVYYLFLRGMSPSRGSRFGVFHDRPSLEAVEALGLAFGATTGEVGGHA